MREKKIKCININESVVKTVNKEWSLNRVRPLEQKFFDDNAKKKLSK